MNRIDSRARGNAPQLLEKYRKLAHDAHLNGDRVTAEYYLQFADHYFRVLADTRQRQEEVRARREDRWQEPAEPYREDSEDGGDFAVEGEFSAFDPPPAYGRREREDHRSRSNPRERDDTANRNDANRNEESRAPVQRGEGDAGNETSNIYEPVENPFVRENRGPRNPRAPRRDNRRPRWEDRDNAPSAGRDPSWGGEVAQPAGTAGDASPLLPLPPAISTGRRGKAIENASDARHHAHDEAPESAAPSEAKPAAKRRTRRKPADDADESFESVN